MRFLVDANMPRSTARMFESRGHSAKNVSEIGLGAAPDMQIAARARTTGAVLVTRDLDFANIRNYPPADYSGIIVVRLPDDAVAARIVNAVERFIRQSELASQVPGRLVILEEGRVRFRPALRH